MAGVSTGALAAAALLEQQESIARAVTGLLYAEMPWLAEKYGERGRRKCLQDVRYNVQYLAPAVELEDPATFVRYAVWCAGVLRARGVAADELARSFELLESDVGARLAAEQARGVAACLRAGVAALRGEGGG